jgi:hypothetical protein
MVLLKKANQEAHLFKEFIMADKDKQPTQADFDKAWENVKKDPKSAPKFIDGMPPEKDSPDLRKGIEEGITKGMGGKKLGMKKGGKVSQLAKSNGIAVRGKTRGKIC